MKKSLTALFRRSQLRHQVTTLKALPYAAVIVLALVSTAPVSPAGQEFTSLSKRALRLNDYLFNGVETVTAIAAMTPRVQDGILT